MCTNGRSTSPLANITLHHSSKNSRAQSFSRCWSCSSPDAAGHALCAVTSARESRLYCSGLHAKLASHCHVVQECSNLVSGEYAGNRALDCARTLGLAPLTGHPSKVHSPMRPEYSTSLLVRARLLFAFLTVVCFSPRCRYCVVCLENVHACVGLALVISSAVLFPSALAGIRRKSSTESTKRSCRTGKLAFGTLHIRISPRFLWTKELHHHPPLYWLYWDQRAHWTALALTTPPANGTSTTALLQYLLRPANTTTIPANPRISGATPAKQSAVQSACASTSLPATATFRARKIPRVTPWHLRPPRNISSESAWPLAL